MDYAAERAKFKQAMTDGQDGDCYSKPKGLSWNDVTEIQEEIRQERINQRKGLEMIKVNVIEKEEKEQKILLGDCDGGDVVELEWQGVLGLVLDNHSLAIIQHEKCDPYLSKTFVKEAINGSGSGKIKRIIGTLTGIEVTAK